MAVRKKLNLIGPTIRDMRMKRSWTQERLAEKLRALGWNVSRGRLSQMEATHQRITDCDLLFLANALEANLADFFPAYEPPEVLKEKILSRRLMVNRRQIPRVLARSKSGRFKSWKPHSV